MTVHADINNVPEDIEANGYIVARVAEDTKLWWYGIYDTEKRAREVAAELGNGIVLERSKD